jgi:tryptophanyl-tRNA synthetase
MFTKMLTRAVSRMHIRAHASPSSAASSRAPARVASGGAHASSASAAMARGQPMRRLCRARTVTTRANADGTDGDARDDAADEGEGDAKAPARRKRVLSGVQPTGSIHLGNYFGAIRNYVKLQDDYDAFYCVVDLHAITSGAHDPRELEASTRMSAGIYLAAGVDPSKANVFVQSHVPAHSELAWLLNCATPIGWLEKMIQFKEKARKAGEDVSVGLLDYPVLMAADILLYKADLVPVGEDQRQHLELTRDIAGRVNSLYGGKKWKKMKGKAPSGRSRGGDVLLVPEAFTPKEGGRVMSLTDGSSKMSKSNPAEGSRINVLDTPDEISKKIKRCKTDTFEGLEFSNPERPESQNLLTMYQLCTGLSQEEVIAECGTMRWGDFKPKLTEAVIEHLSPIQGRYKEIMDEPGYLEGVLRDGADKANEVANITIRDVRDALGFYQPR